jgi:hypothetical protein
MHTRLLSNKIIIYYDFEREYSNKSEKHEKGQKSGKSFGSCSSCSSCLEAARKGYQQGLEGPEKGKGRKSEGKGPVILLMLHPCGHLLGLVFEI